MLNDFKDHTAQWTEKGGLQLLQKPREQSKMASLDRETYDSHQRDTGTDIPISPPIPFFPGVAFCFLLRLQHSGRWQGRWRTLLKDDSRKGKAERPGEQESTRVGADSHPRTSRQPSIRRKNPIFLCPRQLSRRHRAARGIPELVLCFSGIFSSEALCFACDLHIAKMTSRSPYGTAYVNLGAHRCGQEGKCICREGKHLIHSFKRHDHTIPILLFSEDSTSIVNLAQRCGLGRRWCRFATVHSFRPFDHTSLTPLYSSKLHLCHQLRHKEKRPSSTWKLHHDFKFVSPRKNFDCEGTLGCLFIKHQFN